MPSAVTAKNSSGSGTASTPSPAVTPVPSIPGATYFGISASRLLEPTTFKNKVARTVQVTGVDGIPDGAIAVTGNLTVVKPASSGYLAVTSRGDQRPTTSTLNFPAHDIRANGRDRPAGAGRQAQLHLRWQDRLVGPVHLRRDRLLPARGLGRQLLRADPQPAASTRPSSRPRWPRTIQVTGARGIPGGAVAVTGNLTVVNPAYGRLHLGDQHGHQRADDLDPQLPGPRHPGQRRHGTARARAASSSFTYVGKAGSSADDHLRRDRLLPARRLGRELLRRGPQPAAQPALIKT